MEASLDMIPEPMIEKIIGEKEENEGGKIQLLVSDLVPEGQFFATKDVVGTLDTLKEKAKELATEENPKKVETLANGFMFQAGKTQVGEEPFYIEVHLLGEDEYAVSANKNGVLTRNDIKALRKSLKTVMNMEKEKFNLGKKNEAPVPTHGHGAAANWNDEQAYPDPDEGIDEMDFDDYDGDAPVSDTPHHPDLAKMATFIPAEAKEDDFPFEEISTADFNPEEWLETGKMYSADPSEAIIAPGTVVETEKTKNTYQILGTKLYTPPWWGEKGPYTTYWVKGLGPHTMQPTPFHLTIHTNLKVLKKKN